MPKIITALLLAVLVALVGFRLTHHPIYSPCHYQAGECVKTLVKWEGNK